MSIPNAAELGYFRSQCEGGCWINPVDVLRLLDALEEQRKLAAKRALILDALAERCYLQSELIRTKLAEGPVNVSNVG